MSLMNKKSLCIVAENIYPLLRDTSENFMGGAELQQWLIGKYLIDDGFDVAYVTRIQDGVDADEVIGKIHVYKTYDPMGGIPFIRYFHPKISGLWRAMQRANADIYYQRCANFITGIVALFCQIHHKKFIFSAAHDNNFLPDKLNFKHHIDRLLYNYGLKHANVIITQTKKQKELLRANFKLNGHVLNNFYERREITKDLKYVLWVANIKTIKRPFLALDIAKLYPKIEFKMIGGIVDEKYYAKFKIAAHMVDNVEFLGFRNFNETEQFFDGASLFLNTSEMEGFPNTFLQAWSRGIPTLSFVDVDHTIAKNRLGAIINSVTKDNLRIIEHMDYPIVERIRIQNYFNENHSPATYVDKLKSLISGP